MLTVHVDNAFGDSTNIKTTPHDARDDGLMRRTMARSVDKDKGVGEKIEREYVSSY